jgi:hypothetical protein
MKAGENLPEILEKGIDAACCANVPAGFVVVDARERWYDVNESEVLKIWRRFGQKGAD